MNGKGRKTALTLGKFAPLHKGHQYMIETALAETDELIAVIYDCPKTIDVPLPVRAGWIRRLYPQVEVIEAWDGPEESGYTPAIMRKQENYILGLLNGRRITHFYSSEPYGEHMSQALNAVDRRVDPDRNRFPVSGTLVRQAPYEHRQFVDPVVYRDLVTKIVLLGAPSTGKTTLAAALAGELQTVWMPEYGREYWERHQVERRLSLQQLVEIAEGHMEREDKLIAGAKDVFIADTSALTTYQFSLYYHGRALPRLHELAVSAQTRYDLVFVCGDGIPYDDTWDRSGEMQRGLFQQRIIDDLVQRGVPFTMLEGSVAEGVGKVKSVLASIGKHGAQERRLHE